MTQLVPRICEEVTAVQRTLAKDSKARGSLQIELADGNIIRIEDAPSYMWEIGLGDTVMIFLGLNIPHGKHNAAAIPTSQARLLGIYSLFTFWVDPATLKIPELRAAA